MQLRAAAATAFAIAVLSATPAGAQSPVRADSDSVKTPPRAPVTLTEVRTTASPVQDRYLLNHSVTATRTDTPLRDTPQSIGVVTKALIADQAMTGMADVVRYIPGIAMGQGEGHRDTPTIRGNSTTANFFVDGVRDDAQYLRDLYNVERVEALKGPSAMVFGRGAGGGVINRVMKQAGGPVSNELTVEGGTQQHRRATIDLGAGRDAGLAGRLNAMYENSGSFRDQVGLERYGIDPTMELSLGEHTDLHAGYEYFVDTRTVDRGIPSFRGAPAAAPISAFFGSPELNSSFAHVHAAGLTFEHSSAKRIGVRNTTRFARYDTYYQNVFAGPVSASGQDVALSGYAHGVDRSNLFNQTDFTYHGGTGPVWHTLLVGAELGRQATGNQRRTAYFAGGATVDTVPFSQPTIGTAVDFRQSVTDADNDVTATIGALYAQDQIALSLRWQALLGVRVERFALDVANHRNGQRLQRTDRMVSPRAGLIFKPEPAVSLYASYSISHLPASGDQFSSLTETTTQLAPEQFSNYEVGAKWDLRTNLALTTALYRLDRTNTTAPDPNDPSLVVQTGAQRTNGFELGVTGAPFERWQIAGGYAVQGARIVSTTAAAIAGATVPLVPRQTFSLWNRLDLSDALALGAGVVEQARSYTAVSNAVTLPPFTRIDAALFIRLPRELRAQLNVENVGNVRYFPTAQGNNNIMPGAPRTLRASLTTNF